MKEYIWYQGKVAGPYKGSATKEQIEQFKEYIDEGGGRHLIDHPPMNEDMKKHPNDVHILVNTEG